MKIAVLGLGGVGYAFLKALSEDMGEVYVRICDVSRDRLEKASVLMDRIEALQLDLSDPTNVARCIEGVDLVIDALPSRLSFEVLKLCGKKCIDTLSVSFIKEDPFELDPAFRECGKKLVVDAGVAPGLSNVIAGRIASLLDEVQEVGIYVGGIPKEPVGPLKYVVTWSAEDLIEEYTRRARIVRDHAIVEVDPLQEIEVVEIPGIGKFEAFYSDGLRTMLRTLRDRVRNMYEKTLRWPNHLEKIRLLRDLGFFDSEEIEIDGARIAPRRFTAKLLERKLRIEVEDLVLLYVVGKGLQSNDFRSLEYLVVARYDHRRKLSAMSKITGFTAFAIMKNVFVEGSIDGFGLIPPEILGFNDRIYRSILSYLTFKDIEIEVRE